MSISAFFPMWESLTVSQQDQLNGQAVTRSVKKGTVLHHGSLI